MKSQKNMTRKVQTLQDCHCGLEKAHGQLLSLQSSQAVAREIRAHKKLKMKDKSAPSIIAQGARYASGGQQLIDAGTMFDLNFVSNFINMDCRKGTVRVSAGTNFRELVHLLEKEQTEKGRNLQDFWTIRQKPAGIDTVTIGGALASNIHGRGLHQAPFVDDIESIEVVTADGEIREVNREIDSTLFNLIVGGYGLFGVVTAVTLRLTKRKALRRKVSMVTAEDVLGELHKRTEAGAIYGDYQLCIDSTSDDFLTSGILSTYQPEELAPEKFAGIKDNQTAYSAEEWRELLYLAHTDKKMAFAKYRDHCKSTDGKLYLTDKIQLCTYTSGYHSDLPEKHAGADISCELFVPRRYLNFLLNRAARLLRERKADVIYATVRLVEPEKETYLNWATQNYACLTIYQHSSLDDGDLEYTKETCRELIDLALALSGKFYLSYNRMANKDQLLAAYPQFLDFVEKKQVLDPYSVFSSNWYGHHQWLLK